MKIKFLVPVAALFLLACRADKEDHDASGIFESVEILVPAQAEGLITALRLEEGQQLASGEQVGGIDSLPLILKKEQLEAQIEATLARKPDVPAQLAALRAELAQARHELERNENLAKDGSIPGKQLDDAAARVRILQKQISGSESALEVAGSGLTKEAKAIHAQIALLEDQISKCRIVNPIKGTVLSKYAEPHEMAMPGKPLYKVADLSSMILRAYVGGDALQSLRPGMAVTVFTGAGEQKGKTYEGTLEWISSDAEFTPKTIQTKDERANLVYALKIRVKNDGFLKIGMYGDVDFNNSGK